MQKFRTLFRDSAAELRRPQALAITALLVALNLTLDLLNIRIQLTQDLRIGVGFVTNAMVGLLFGPVPAMTAGVASDFLGWLLNPGGGGYFPGFTVTALLAGLVWGLCFYRKPLRWWRCLEARLIIGLVLNLGLNTVWKWMLYGPSTLATLPLKAVKNLALMPFEVLLLLLVGKLVLTVYAKLPGNRPGAPGR